MTQRNLDDLKKPIFELFPNLSKRATNSLFEDNIYFLAQLLAKTKAELIRIPNFGKVTLRELEVCVSSLGWKIEEFSEDDDFRKAIRNSLPDDLNLSKGRLLDPDFDGEYLGLELYEKFKQLSYQDKKEWLGEQDFTAIIEAIQDKVAELAVHESERNETLKAKQQKTARIGISNALADHLANSPKLGALQDLIGPDFLIATIREHPDIADAAVEAVVSQIKRKLDTI